MVPLQRIVSGVKGMFSSLLIDTVRSSAYLPPVTCMSFSEIQTLIRVSEEIP
jgi:hypothetical protein